jgi:hypothetical protein
MSWGHALAYGIWSGSVASVVTTAVLAACGAAERRSPPGPLNGPSQWIWGEQASYRRGFSVRYTVIGFVIHHAMSVLWATVFERFNHRERGTASPAKLLATAAATSAVASLIDLRVVPSRLSPGFERQLSRPSLFMTYGAFALALAGAAWFARK